jgi:tetratricopeptide (TPR) repeat protein
VFVLFVLASASDVISEVPFPDSLYIPRLGVKNNRAAGTSLPISPGGTLLLADIEGPGIIRHFWMTNEKVKTEQAIADGKVTIRFYWDGHEEPDLEVPLNEFFGKKFTDAEEISWLENRKSKNAYYTMPFRKSVEVELKNNTDERLNDIYWQIDYEKVPEIPGDVKYFDLNTRVSKPVSLDSTKKANRHIRGEDYLNAKSPYVIAELEGPSVIRRIQISYAGKDKIRANRGVILRIHWDNENNPSVEVPLGDFFGVGFGEDNDFTSQAWVRENGNKQIFFPMPFKKSARIELANLNDRKLGVFSWQIDYEKDSILPEDTEYFHASFRISRPVPLNSVHRAIEINGRGKFVGLVWNHHWLNKGMHAEGTQNFWIDGEHIQATGSEDFFGQAWGFYKGVSHPYMGNSFGPEKSCGDEVGEWYRLTAYRAFLLDPIHFQQSLELSLTCYGVDVGHKTDEYSTTCFWYQSEPHTAFYPLPPAEDLYPVDFPQSFAFGMWQIYNLERQRKYSEAINKIEELSKTYPRNPKVADLLFKKGYLLEEQSKVDGALAIYKKVKKRFPHSEAARDADDKIWLFERPGRMLMKMASPSGWDAYLDGNEIPLDESIFQNTPTWGVDKIYRFTWGPYKVHWDDRSSIVMRLLTIRLEPGSGEHTLAVEAMTKKDAPILSPKLGYLFAAIDIVGPDIVTDDSWKLSSVETEGWKNEGFNDNEWSQATVYKLDEYPDSTWTWLWLRTFRNFPVRAERLWDENLKMNANKEFKQTLFFRKTISIPASFSKEHGFLGRLRAVKTLISR